MVGGRSSIFLASTASSDSLHFIWRQRSRSSNLSTGRLDGISRPSGCLPPSPCPSGLSEVPPVLYWPSHLPVSGSLLWTVLCSAGLYSCHGPDLLQYASPRLPDPPLSGRLASPWFFSRGDCPGKELLVISLLPSRSTVLVNLSKSLLHPTQSIDYLGMSLHSSPLRAFPTQARIQKVLSLVSEFTSSPAPPLPLWRSLLGVMSSLTPLIPGARLRMRSLQLCLRVAGPQTSDMAQISWDDSCHRDLLWWSDASHLVGGVPLDLPHPGLLLFTDASDTGWGATLGSDHLSGLWTQEISLYSINHRELLAILYAIRGFLHLLRS